MDKLSEIMAAKRREIEPIIRPIRDSELSNLGERLKGNGPSFLDALSSPDELSVIAEIKRKSPSAGEIATGTSAVEQAREYINAHADCLSILTDQPYFGGTLQDLWDVNDFICVQTDQLLPYARISWCTRYRCLEALEAGAKAILY